MNKTTIFGGIAVLAAAATVLLGGYAIVQGTGQQVDVAGYSVSAAPTPAPEQDTSSTQAFLEHEASQMRADDLAAQAVAKAEADQAAAQAAAQTETKAPVAKATTDTGPVKCPAGSTVQGYDDNNNATACIPDICMNGIGGPGQPTNEQCVVFKP